jgi:hypothetical protein
VHQHKKTKEDPSLVVVSSPVLGKIQSYSFLLGLLMTAFCNASSAVSAHVLPLFGNDTAPGMATLFSIMWSCTTSAINTLGFYYALDRLIIYPLSCDMSEANETIINSWHISCRVGLGTLMGVCSAWVLIALVLGMDMHLKYSAGMLVGVVMFSLMFQVYSDNKRIMDSAEMCCADKVHSDTLLIV